MSGSVSLLMQSHEINWKTSSEAHGKKFRINEFDPALSQSLNENVSFKNFNHEDLMDLVIK